jgi:fatty-acyl-CoA synthase
MGKLAALVERNLAERSAATAFFDGERRISHAEFDVLRRRTAAWLAAQGIGRGDRVAVWLVNRIEWLALLFGLAQAGAALVAVNTRFRAAELEYLLERSGARMLVLQLNFRGIDFPAVLAEVRAELPALEKVAVVGAASTMPPRVLGKPVVAFDALDRTATEVADHADPDAPAAMFTTSGTTKGPKLVVHSQRTLAYHASKVAAAFGFDAPDARLLAGVPFGGVFGLSSALGAYAGGAPIVLMETFEPHAAATLARSREITHMFGPDALYRRLLEAAPGNDPFPAARMFGFAPMQAGGVDFAAAACAQGVPMFGLYGSSELHALFAVQAPSLTTSEQIAAGGRPVAGNEAEVRIRDVDSGALLPAGQSGEIEIRAPSNFVGYYNNPEATAEALRPDGFFRTGDIGQLREDGSFLFETRRGDAIRLAGFLVNPAEIEDVIKRVSGVADAQVIGVEIGGNARCIAFVIRTPGSQTREEDIAGACSSMAAFKMPARIWFIAEFPATQSANGTKIQRGLLREMALERLLSEGS